MSDEEVLNKINIDENYRTEILIDLNVSLQLMERYTYTQKDKFTPTEYKIAVVSLEQENQQLKEDNFKLQARADKYKCRIDKAIEFIENNSSKYDRTGDGYTFLDEDEIEPLLEILKGDNNE